MIAGYLWTTTQDEEKICFDIREDVFVKEQGFSKDNEFDIIDTYANHLLFFDDDKPAGTARLYEKDCKWHIGRVAVNKDYRKKGIGKFLILECIQKAKEIDSKKVITVSAQERISEFYKKLGFIKEGEIYLDEYCPHIRMVYRG